MKTNIQTCNQNMKHQNKTKTHKYTYDHYDKCICIRSMTYTIAKTWREHKIWVHFKHG